MAEKFTLNSSGEKLFDMADYSRSCSINDRTNFLIIRITGAEKEIILDWENNLMIYDMHIFLFESQGQNSKYYPINNQLTKCKNITQEIRN